MLPSLDHAITASPDHQITRSPDRQITRSPDHSITRSPNHSITQSLNNQIKSVSRTGFYLALPRGQPDADMKFLANENFPLSSILYLRKKGFDIMSVGIDTPGITDQDIMTIASNEERTIITFDRDYGELIFKFNYKPGKGVIYLRLDMYDPEEPGQIIEELILKKSIHFDHTLTVVARNGIRQRKY